MYLWPSSDQSFDIPDRTFHSMNTTWRLSSYESMTDVKELIPEFFYLPEFLVNREGKRPVLARSASTLILNGALCPPRL